MNWPSYKIRRHDPIDRQKLSDWLVEWNLDQALRDTAPTADATVMPLNPSNPHVRYDMKTPPLPPGSICLLPPTADSRWGPVYVVVLSGMRDDVRLIAPFSRLSTPAFWGEWATGISVPVLRVLCCWNARIVSSRLLQILPKAGKLPAVKTRKAIMIYQHVQQGDPIPDALRSQLGPPLLHPADPRHDYCEEEQERLDIHLATDQKPKNTIEFARETSETLYPAKKYHELLLAAERRQRSTDRNHY